MSKILLIEDEEVTYRTLIGRLQAQGHDVVLATDGESALSCLTDNSLNLIIMDWMIPGSDAIEMLKENKKAAKTPVIILTSKRVSFDRDLCLMHGAKAYLNKPVDFKDLSEAIGKYLKV